MGLLPAVRVIVPTSKSGAVRWEEEGGDNSAELEHRREGRQVQLQVDGVLNQLRKMKKPTDALMVVAVRSWPIPRVDLRSRFQTAAF